MENVEPTRAEVRPVGAASTASHAQWRRLRVWNAGVAAIHAVQAVVILALSNGFTLPITISFMTGPPGTASTTNTVYDLPIGPMVSVFLLLAAIDHGLMAAPHIHR